MSIQGSQQRTEARYALQVAGIRDEFGLSENVYRFEACLAGRDGQVSLSTIHGLLIHHDGSGDFYLKIRSDPDDTVRSRYIQTSQGALASEMIRGGVDVQVTVHGRDLLFLHTPRILDINAQLEPGTRLISALQRHFSGRNLEVILDLGIDEESEAFEGYFFPDLDLLGMHSQSLTTKRGLKYGKWGSSQSEAISFSIGVDFETGSEF